MRRDKKIISIILSIAIVITSCSVAFFAKAQKEEVNINIELLDSILNDRYWIIETLVSGDISNNPYSNINPSSTNQTLMDEVLENYQNDKAFKALVDAMDVYSNTGQYLSGFADDILSTFEGWFGSSDSADKIVASTGELKYESILNEIIKTDYTSSWGDTLFEENMDMEELKQQSKILKKIKSYQTVLKDEIGLNRSESSSIVIYDPYNTKTETFEIDIEDYAGHFLDAYEQDLGEYLNNTVEIPAIEGNKALKKKILATGALGMVTAYERTVIPKTNFDLDDIYYDGMYEDTMKIMKGAGKLLKITDKTMDCAILLEALQSQKNTTVQTMNRISSTTTDKDLAKVLDNYADLVNSAGDEKTLAYEAITNYLRNEQTVTNIITKKTKEQAPKLIKKAANKYAGAKTVVLSNAIAKAIAIVELSVWVADQTTGIEDTAKKIFVCKYLNKILNEAENVCLDDILAYKNDKTDENAEKVLSDLQFLKELRLYGEKSAYGSMCAQMESWIGIMLGGGDTKEYLDRRYQASIDTYLGCTFTPITQNEFSLSQGDVLTLTSDDVNNKSYSEAILKKADGSTVYFAEADYRLMGGIDLNGATVNILTAPNGFYLPLIENDTNGSVINIYCDNVAFGTISNTSDLTIEIKKSDKTFEITDSIDNNGTLNITNSLSSSKVSVYDINNSENINVTNCVLQCKGTPTNNGTITGMVDICGDGSQSYDNAYFKMGAQTMLGTGTYSDLYFNNSVKEGVRISGTQTVTNYISDGSTRLRTSENLVLTGNCSVQNNRFNNSVSFKDYYSSSPLIIDGTGVIYNDVTLGAVTTFNDGLNVTSSCKTLTLNGETNVKGDMNYAGGTIAGSDWLKLHGDLKISTSNPSISNLDFVGVLPQNVSSSSELTVSKLNNHNVSLSGVNFSNVIKVTDMLQSGSTSAYSNAKNVVLTGTARLNDDTIKGTLSAKDWTCSDSANIKGTLFTSGAIKVTDSAKLSVMTYNQSDGTLSIDAGSVIDSSGDFSQLGTTDNAGNIIVGGDSKISGAFKGGGISFKGDVQASALLQPDTVIVNSKTAQTFTNSSDTEVKNLYLKNSSDTGFTVGSQIKVTELLSNNSEKLNNGSNVLLTGSATVKNGSINGSISASNWICNDNINVKGQFTLNGDNTVSTGKKIECIGFNQKSGTLTLDDESELVCSGDFMQAGTVTNNSSITVKGDSKITGVLTGGTLNIKGDLTASNTLTPDNLNFDSNVSQVFNNSSSTTVKKLSIKNTSNTGFNVGSVITVTEYFDNQCKNLINGENIVLTNKSGYFTNSETKGNFTIAGDFTVSSGENLVVNGKLNLKSGANITIEDGGSLTVKKYVNSSSAVINIDEGGLMQIDDYFSSSSDTLNINGNLLVKGDARISSSTVNANGLITFKGDLSISSGTWNKPNIAFVSKLPQVVSGSSVNVNDLTVDNSSKTGISFSQAVNYYGTYENNSSVIADESKLVKKS